MIENLNISFGNKRNSGFLVLSLIFLMNLCFTTDILAQDDDYHKMPISELFKNPKKIKWVKHYRGRVDDLNDVGLIIAYDGKYCKGFITYLRSKERFKLEGKIINGNKLSLRETDSEESVTGHFEGDIKKDYSAIKAHWFNREKTKAGVIQLELSDREVVFPGYCGDNKWVRKYTGSINNEDVTFVLQRNSEYDLKGVMHFEGRKRSYNMVGAAINDSEFKVSIVNDLGDRIAVLEGKVTMPHFRVIGTWIDMDGKKSKAFFGKVNDMTVGCIEYQDYMTTYDVTYPKSKNAAFNDYVDMTVGNWKDSCQEHVKNLKEENPNPGPNERSIASAAGWFETEHMTDKLISGYLTFNKSWEMDYEDIAFNYDLVKGKSFTLYDLFNTGVDYKSILKEKALNKLQFTSIYGNEDFKEWITNEEFELFTIRGNGIRFSTAFHSIYGRQSVTIPFSDIEEHLNPYSPVAHLYVTEVKEEAGKKKKKANK